MEGPHNFFGFILLGVEQNSFFSSYFVQVQYIFLNDIGSKQLVLPTPVKGLYNLFFPSYGDPHLLQTIFLSVLVGFLI